MRRSAATLIKLIPLCLLLGGPVLSGVQQGPAPTAQTTATAVALEAVFPVASADDVKVDLPNVDVNVGKKSRAWYQNPVWLIAGVLAVGMALALIISASRRKA